MNSRTFYFLQDSISKEFYTGQNNWMSMFQDGAVYYKEDNAIKGMKRVINGWLHEQKYAKGKELPDGFDQTEVNLRKNIENWGIVIVSGKIKL